MSSLAPLFLCLIALPAMAQQTDRWRNYVNDSFLSPRSYFATFMPALGEQRANKPYEYGQGWDAFGNRLGRRAALVQMQNAMFHGSAAALRTETAYRSCECSGGLRRFGWALTRTFVTRTDGGANVPNVALLGAHIGGSMIATTWYPDRYTLAGEGLRMAGFQVGARTMSNVLREFRPELKRIFRRK